MTDRKTRMKVLGIVQNYGAIIFFVTLVIYNCLFTKKFFRIQTFWNLVIQCFPTMMLALGSTLVISSGNINISLGSMMALSAVLFAMMINAGWNFALAVFLSIIIAVIPGWLSGFLVAKFKFPAMIVTMAFMYMLRGIASVVCNGFAITYKATWILNLTMIKVGGFLPIQLLISILIFFALYFFVQRTPFGIRMQATGVNPAAAEISGINTRRVIVVSYIISMLLASVAGVEQAMMVSIGDPGLASNSTFDGICATVVGGTAMGGGKANMVGTFFAAFFLQLITVMCNMKGLHYAYGYVIKAALIFAACAVQTLGQKDD